MPHLLENPKVILSSFVFFSLTIFVPPSFAGNNVSVWTDTSMSYTNVTGRGYDSSALTEGLKYYSVTDMKSRGKIGEYDYSLNLGLKATDDERRDSEKLSITQLKGRISNNIHTLNIGDTYEAFSKYSLNTAIKGASYRYNNKNSRMPEVTLLGGVAYSRWDNIWDTDATERKLYGFHLKQQITTDFQAAVSVIQIDDHVRNFNSPLYDGSTYTLDLEYRPIPGLILVSEVSSSHITADHLATASVDHNDYAYRIEAIGDADPSRVVLEYERIEPEYLTVVGSATPDREKVKGTWRYKYNRKVTVHSGFIWYRDNLDNQLTTRTDHYKPSIKVSSRQFLGRRYAVGTVGYKMDRSYNSDVSTQNHFISTGYRDRFGIFDSNTNIGFSFYDTKTTRDTDEFIANTSLSTRITAASLIWKPAIHLGGWRADDELTDNTDYIYDYSFDLGCDIPKHKITINMKVGEHELRKDDSTADDSERLYGNISVYYRPQVSAKLKNFKIYLRGFINDYSYTTGSRDFQEDRITLGFTGRI